MNIRPVIATLVLGLALLAVACSDGSVCNGSDCQCQAGESCDLECPEGDCNQQCSGDCTASCEQGGCDQQCSPGATCTFECEGGGCTQQCSPGGDCTLNCAGGDCVQSCLGSQTCTLSCGGGGCSDDQPQAIGAGGRGLAAQVTFIAGPRHDRDDSAGALSLRRSGAAALAIARA